MSESDQQTTGGGNNRSDEKTEKTSDGTFRSTFKFSFGRKRTTEGSKTQVAHQGHSAVSKDQSLQLSEVSSIVPEDKGPDVLPKPEKSSVKNLQVESQCTDSDNIIEKTEPSTVQQQEQEDENNVKDQLQLAVTLETEESSVQNIQGESQVLQHLGTESDNTTENIEPPTVQEQENGDNKDQLEQAVSPHYQSALLETEESSVESKHAENQVLQPLGTESDNTTENTEPSTVQQQEREKEENNKDQLQQAATPESQDFNDTEESPVENTQTEELSEEHVLQPDILESFDPYVAQEDEDKKENETQRQRSPEYQHVLSDPEESSVQNEESNEHSEDILDILESFDPIDNTGQSTVKSEEELQEHEQPKRIRSTTPEFQDALFDPEDPEEHTEGRGLQSPDVLGVFDPLDTTGKQYNKKDDKTQVSTTFEEPPTDPEESSTETKEHSEDQVLQSSDLLESFDPLANTGKSTIQQEYKKDDETQKQASTDFQDSPLDPTEESSSPAQNGHGSEHEKNDQTQNTVEPDQDEDYDESLLWFDTPEYLDILQQEPPESRLEQKQAENEVNSMQWSDSVEHQDVPQDSKQSLEQFEEDRTQQSLSVENQTEDQGNSQTLQWSDSLEYYDGNEERIKDHEEDSSDQMKTQEPANDMNQGILLSDVPEGKEEQTIQEESMVKEDQADQNGTSPIQLLSGGPEERDVTTIAEPSDVQQYQDEGQVLGQVLLLSESSEDQEVSSTQKQPVVQTYEKEKSNVSDSSELQASSTLPTKPQQYKDVEPDTSEALPVPSSERLENQDALHLQKQPVAQQDQNDEDKSNVLSESDSSESDSEFQDVPLQDEEDESSQSESSTDQDVSPTLTIQQEPGKEPDTSQALPLPERTEQQEAVPLQQVQQDLAFEKEKSDVLFEADSSEFHDVHLQKDEDEGSQSDSSRDEEASSTPHFTSIQQHEGKEPDTSQALPLPESTEEQEAVPLPNKPVVQQDQIYEKKKSDVLFEADSSEFQDVQLQKDEDEGSQSDSSRDEEASSTPDSTSIQQHEGKEPDTSQVLPLPESTEEQEAVPLPKQLVVQQDQIYEKKKSDVLFEADSSEFQDVQLQKPEKEEDEASQSDSSRDEKVSSTPDSTSIQQQECKEQDSSHALPLGESQEVQDFPPYPKQATVRQDQTDEKEKGDVSSESDSSDFQDVPLHDEENESSQSDSSTDQEDSTTLPKQSQHQDKEQDSSKTQPMSERQEDSSLLEQSILSPHEAQEDMTNQGTLLSEDTDIPDASPLAKQREESQTPLSSEAPKSQDDLSIVEQLTMQQYKTKDDDITKVALFDPEDQELPLSEGSTDQDETPLQYFNTSESESSELQDVSSEDEDVSIFPEMTQVRYQAKEHKSQVLSLSENKDTSRTKKSTVQQQADEQEKIKAPSDSESDSLELEDVPSPVGKFPAQRYGDKGLDKSRASVESEITEDEGVLLSPLTPPQEKRSLVLEGSDDTKRKKGSASPKPDDLENRLLEANATIATLLGELDQVRGEIKERANIGADVVTESGHRQKADTPQTTVRSVEIGVNTEEDKIQEYLSQLGVVDDNVTTKQGQANTAMGDSGAKKQQKTVSRGIQTDFADTAQLPAEKSEDSEAGEGERPTGKTDSKSKTKSAIVEMMKDDRELKAKFNIAENLKKALAAKSKGAQQGKAEATPSEEVVKVEEIRHLDRITFGGKGSELGKFNRPRGVAVSSKNEIFVADRDNRRIQVHNMKGETLREIPTTVPGQETLTMRPDDIAIDGNDLMWIVGSDWSTEFVIPYTMEGEPLGKFDLPDTVRFRGITVNPRNDHVIVTLTDKTFGTRGEVRVFRPDGWQLRRVGLNQGMVAPMFVTLDKDDNILVSDYGTHSVYAFDQEGTFLFKFGGYGSGVGQLKDPRGICVDGAGNIIVADFGNKRLEMFSNRGKFLRHVTDSTGRPDGIAVGPDGQLVVTEWNHTASIIPSY